MTALIYASRDEARDDRQQQERLLEALDAAPGQLRRDACGLWIIAGRRGTIQTWGDGRSWLVYVIGRSARHWTAIKRRFAFMTVTQDGDEEGCLRLVALPTRHEAAIIRGAVGLRKRVAYAPDTLERKRASMARALSARESTKTTRPGIAMPEEVAGDFSRQGGLVVKRVGREVRSALIATGVSGRFRAQEPVSAPGLVPEDLPTHARGKFAAKASIKAGRMTEPEEPR